MLLNIGRSIYRTSAIVNQLMDHPVLEDISALLEKHFLHWLEVLSINQAGNEVVGLIETLWESAARFPVRQTSLPPRNTND